MVDRPGGDRAHPWGRGAEVFRARRRSAGVQRRPQAHPRLPESGIQQPVWFNCGFEQAPHARLFINSVQDTMDSILTLARTEGMPVQVRVGHRHNLSTIRSSREAGSPMAEGVRGRCRS